MSFIYMPVKDLILAADALDLLDKVEGASALAARLRVRLAELADEGVQARWDAYRAGVDADDELEVDDDALVSEGDDNGAFVLTWTWVTKTAAGICEECGATNADNGEGYDGLCGDCADKAEPADEDEETA